MIPLIKEREATPADWQRRVRDSLNAVIRFVAMVGASTERPNTPTDGQSFYDDTLKRPVWYNSEDSAWRGAEGVRKAVTKTADFTQSVTEWRLINNKAGSACTATLLSPATYPDETIEIMNMQAQTVVSASSNVCPIGSATAGTAILPATIGAWCRMASDGTAWRVIARGT